MGGKDNLRKNIGRRGAVGQSAHKKKSDLAGLR